MDAAAALDTDTRRRIAIGATVAAVHAAILLWLGLSVVPVLPEVTTQAMDVVMMRLPPTPMDDESPVVAGGRAPAPSTVHAAPDSRPEAVELTAPVEPAPVQPLVLGVAPRISPVPSTGDSGIGTGSGGGEGAGEGPGVGGGSGAVLINGPVGAVMSREIDPAVLVATGQSHVVLRCQIRVSQRLDNCRIIGEYPRPSGYRQEALRRSREFRFRPPQRMGRPIDRRPIVVGIAFPGPTADPSASSVDQN